MRFCQTNLYGFTFRHIFSIVGRYHIGAVIITVSIAYFYRDDNIVHRPNLSKRWTVRVLYRPSSSTYDKKPLSIVKSVREVCPPPFAFHKLSWSVARINPWDGRSSSPAREGWKFSVHRQKSVHHLKMIILRPIYSMSHGPWVIYSMTHGPWNDPS